MITSEKKKIALQRVQRHKSDTGSEAVQVALTTERIKELTEHLKGHDKDLAARRGLLKLVGRRRRLLHYLADRDSKAYLELLQKLNIRR